MERNKSKIGANVPALRFPGFRGIWKKESMKDIAKIIGGGTPDTSVKSFWDGGIRWFTPSEIGKEKFISTSERTISEEGLKNSAARLLPPFSILLNSRASIGDCSINVVACAVSQGCHGLIASSGCDHDFLYCLMQKLREEMLRKACGSAFREISAKAIGNMAVYVPKTQEQRKIASFFSLLDKRIATQNKIFEAFCTVI